MRAKLFVILAILINFSASQIALSAENLFKANQLIKNAFGKGRITYSNIDKFNYRSYLNHIYINNITMIDRHRRYVERFVDGGGDRFVAKLVDEFTKHFQVRANTINVHITVAEQYVAKKKRLNRRDNRIYRMSGYHIFAKVASYLEREVNAGRMESDSAKFRGYFKRLLANKIYIRLKVSSYEKLVRNAKKCASFDADKCGYLAQRAWQKAKSYFPGTRDGTKFNLKLVLSDFGTTAGKAVSIHRLSKKGDTYGHSIWFDRPTVKAKYFATSGKYSAYNQMRNWVSQRRIAPIAALSGGFTNRFNQPEGLTAQNGNLINPVMLHDRDGTVMFMPNGGVRVVNLEKKSTRLPDLKQTLNPRESLINLVSFLNWIERRRATLFQTQLLAYEDQLFDFESTGPGRLRERRVLALVRTKSGDIKNVVFDITKSMSLFDAASTIYRTLKARDMRVFSLVNLDVGSYNILRVWRSSGRNMTLPKGPVAIEKATNLIFYYVEK